MLRSAELGALSAVDPVLGRHDRDVRLPAGNEVLLARQARDPEAVDHVVGMKRDADWYSNRQVQFVRRPQDLRRVATVVLYIPPPLVRSYVDRELFVRGGPRHRTV